MSNEPRNSRFNNRESRDTSGHQTDKPDANNPAAGTATGGIIIDPESGQLKQIVVHDEKELNIQDQEGAYIKTQHNNSDYLVKNHELVLREDEHNRK